MSTRKEESRTPIDTMFGHLRTGDTVSLMIKVKGIVGRRKRHGHRTNKVPITITTQVQERVVCIRPEDVLPV